MDEKAERKKESAASGKAESAKKPYISPRLEVFGHVKDLTMGVGGTFPDGFAKRRGGG